MTNRQVDTWRSVIRIFACVAAIFGLILIANVILENVVTCSAGKCSKLPLGAMLWGLTLLSFGCLMLQRGDVTMSLKDLTTAGNSVATWFGRRTYDRKSVAVAPVVCDDCKKPVGECECPDETPAARTHQERDD